MPQLSRCNPYLPLLPSPALGILLLLAQGSPAQVEWQKPPVLQNPWGTTVGFAMEYDSARSRIVLTGNATNGLLETWEWDGTSWNLRLPAVSPPPRTTHAVTFDSRRGRLVLFGGTSGSWPLGDTWEWDGTNWTRHSPATSPSARAGHAMAFDPVRGRTVLFGGSVLGGAPGLSADTWEWDGINWVQMNPASAPSARAVHRMAFDSARSRTLLYGGVTGTGVAGDAWEWDGARWIQLAAAAAPGPRSGHALAADPSRGVVMLVGGASGNTSTFYTDHWEWNGTTWTLRAVQQGFLPRTGHVLAHDAARQRSVLFGGRQGDNFTQRYPSDTWEWDGAAWSQAAPPTNPDGVVATDLVFDHAQQRTIGFSLYYREAWTWNGARWSRAFPTTLPPHRFYSGMAADPRRRRIVLFGGYDGNRRFADTWEWDGNNWSQRSPLASPSARDGFALAFHSASRRAVLFGGYDGSRRLADTWEWDGSNWTLRATPIAPSPRAGAALADDGARGVLVLFGGYDGNRLADTWEWDGNAWTLRPVVGPQVHDFRSVYDRARRRVVLTGGSVVVNVQETWEWDGSSWTLRTTAMAPRTGLLAFDPVRRRTVLYGGSTWEYGPVYPAEATPFGTGCPGSAGTPSLAPTSLPWIGDTLDLEVTNLAASVSFVPLVFGFSDQSWNGQPLPLSLQPLGMPGCAQQISADALGIMTLSGTNARFALQIPSRPSLLGLTFFHQAAVFEPGANPAGIVVTNATRGVIGGR